MSRNRNEAGQFTEEVSLADVLAVFDGVLGPVVTTSDVVEATRCSDDSARRTLGELSNRAASGAGRPPAASSTGTSMSRTRPP